MAEEVLVVLEVLVASVVVPVVVAALVAVPVVEAVEASAVLADSKERKRLRSYSEAFSVVSVSSSGSLKSVIPALMRILYQEMSFLI